MAHSGRGMVTGHNTSNAYQLRLLLKRLLLGLLACANVSLAEDVDAIPLLRWIPADVAFAVAINDVHELDHAVARVARRTGLGVDESGLRAWVQDEIPLGGWLDLRRPIAYAVRAGAAEDGVIAWGHVANLAARIAQSDGATNRNGVWCLPDGSKGSGCLKTLGDYIVTARSGATLRRMSEGGESLVDVRRGTRDLLRTGDALAHFNMVAHRDRALAFVKEMATLGPLTGMLIGQQLKGGAEETETLMAAIFDGAEELVRQSRFVDIGLRVGVEAVDVTCVVSFENGAVRRYLDKQKPAAHAPFHARATRPYFLALSYELPRGEPGGGAYLLDKMIQYHSDQDSGSAEAKRSGTGAGDRVSTSTLTAARLLTRMVHRMNVRLTMESDELVISGDCGTANAQVLLEQIRAARHLPHARAGSTRNPKDESPGYRRRDAAGVERIPLEWERAVPGLARLMAKDAILAVGAQSDRMRFCFAGSDAVDAFFGQPAGGAAASRTTVALAALPEHANLVLLVDAARTLAVLQRLWGASVGATPAPGPLVALSVSLNAGQVALHLHVPLGAIERLQNVLGHSDQS